jgi:hypothetical protein
MLPTKIPPKVVSVTGREQTGVSTSAEGGEIATAMQLVRSLHNLLYLQENTCRNALLMELLQIVQTVDGLTKKLSLVAAVLC